MIARIFLTADAIGSSLLGIFLFFAPHIVGDFVFQRVTDGVHWHLIRCVGGQLLAGGLCSFLLRNANKISHTVCYIMRIVACILMLLLFFQSRSMTPELVNPEMMEPVKNILFGGVALNVVMLVGSGWPIGNQLIMENRIGNSLYQLDSIASIVIGGAWLTFPKWLLHKQVLVTLDESHEMCGRIMGVLFVCSFAVAQYALHWPSAKDRQVAIDCRVLCCAAILSAQVWSQIAYKADWSEGHWVGIALYSIWTGASILYRLISNFCGSRKHKKNL